MQRGPRTEVVEAEQLGGPGVVADRQPGRGVARPDGVPHDRPVRVARPRGALGAGLDGRGLRRGCVRGYGGQQRDGGRGGDRDASAARPGATAGRGTAVLGRTGCRSDRDCVGEVTRAPPSVDGPWWSRSPGRLRDTASGRRYQCDWSDRSDTDSRRAALTAGRPGAPAQAPPGRRELLVGRPPRAAGRCRGPAPPDPRRATTGVGGHGPDPGQTTRTTHELVARDIGERGGHDLRREVYGRPSGRATSWLWMTMSIRGSIGVLPGVRRCDSALSRSCATSSAFEYRDGATGREVDLHAVEAAAGTDRGHQHPQDAQPRRDRQSGRSRP